MLGKFNLLLIKDQVWVRVITLATVLFFVFLSDAVLSFWVPVYFERVLKSATLTGLIMGFSSIVGLVLDVFLPQIIKSITVRKLILFSVVTNFVFCFLLIWSSWTPYIFLLLFSMASWGIYYELLSFAQQQFVSDATPLKFHTAAWGIIGVFKNLAYFLGPIIVGNLWRGSGSGPLYLALIFSGISFLILSVYGNKHDRPLSIEIAKVSFRSEFGHWVVLFKHVWPVLILSTLLGVIDATFWSVGAIYTDLLSEKETLGGMFLSFYMLPSLFMGFVLAKWGIYKKKKKTAIKFLVFAGIFFSLLGLFDNLVYISLLVFLASLAISVAFPLVDGVYSDIVARMGRERKHMIGLSISTISLAYIFGPPLAGFIADMVGYKETFVVLGFATALICTILFLSTPKKLLLPQAEIGKWED